MRCKCCDDVLKDSSPLWRTIDMGDNVPEVRVMEDMCHKCRGEVVTDDDDDLFNYSESLKEWLLVGRYEESE